MVTMDKINREKNRGNPWVMWGFVIFIVLAFLAVATPMTMR